MPEERFQVGVVAERRAVDNPWVDHVWEPVAVLPGVPAPPPWTALSRTERVTAYYIGPAEVVLASTETANYRDNLIEGRPRLWVIVRAEGGEAPLSLACVTADPKEGEAYAESESNIVAPVPMPPEIAARVAAFVDEHHVERQFVKRRRNRLALDEQGRRTFSDGGDGGRE